MTPIGYYDPDEDERPAKVPAKYTPRDDLDHRMVKSVGCKYYSNQSRYQNWKKIRGIIQGVDEASVLYRAWVIHNIGIAERLNARRIHLTMDDLFRNILDERYGGDNRNTWIAKNREKVLQERAKSIEDLYFKKK